MYVMLHMADLYLSLSLSLSLSLVLFVHAWSFNLSLFSDHFQFWHKIRRSRNDILDWCWHTESGKHFASKKHVVLALNCCHVVVPCFFQLNRNSRWPLQEHTQSENVTTPKMYFILVELVCDRQSNQRESLWCSILLCLRELYQSSLVGINSSRNNDTSSDMERYVSCANFLPVTHEERQSELVNGSNNIVCGCAAKKCTGSKFRFHIA